MDELKSQLENAAAEVAPETAVAQEETTEETSTVEADDSKNTDDSKVDEYKTLLEAERAKREKAEKKVVELKRQAKANDDDEVQIDTTAILEEARKVVREEILALRGEEVGATMDSVLETIAATPSERELIAFHYANTINKSGTTKADIEKDLQRAKLIANEAKLVTQNNELRQALQSKATVTSTPEFSGATVQRGHREVLSADERNMIQRLGLKEDDVLKRMNK